MRTVSAILCQRKRRMERAKEKNKHCEICGKLLCIEAIKKLCQSCNQKYRVKNPFHVG